MTSPSATIAEAAQQIVAKKAEEKEAVQEGFAKLKV